MSSIHLELLDKERKEVFEKLKIFSNTAVLGGGTALSLQIAHRMSFDFDLFLEKPIEREDLLKLRRILEIAGVQINTSQQLTVVTNNNVNITLLNYPFKQLFSSIATSFLPLCFVNDISADKAYTVGRRAAWRDYVDLYFVLKQNLIDIFELIKLTEQKFGIEFNPKLFLEQLIYFEDIEISKISFVKEEPSVSEIQIFLKHQVGLFKEKELGRIVKE